MEPVPARAAFLHRDFRLYQAGSFLSTLGSKMLATAVGYQVYELTARPLSLGFAGLAGFLPTFLLTLVSGDVADRYDRRAILAACHAISAVASLLLFVVAGRPEWGVTPIYGAIALDLFAVLLGGATALIPIYARDILRVGPLGNGILRSAPALGAAIMAVSLAHRPVGRNAGRKMLVAVAIFGAGTIVFGVSR